jgi:hypothetical protein
MSCHNLFSQPDLPLASLASQEPPLQGKAVSHLSVASIGLVSLGRLLTLPAYIRQECKAHDNEKHTGLLRLSNN